MSSDERDSISATAGLRRTQLALTDSPASRENGARLFS
jgi:hypothetical protein